MKEVIILEIKESRKSHLVQGFLKQKKIDYRILTETQLELNDNLKEKEREKEQLKKRLIAAYKRMRKNKNLQKELALWDRISGDGLDNEKKHWEEKEKFALREWEKLSDEELINEWEKLPND